MTDSVLSFFGEFSLADGTNRYVIEIDDISVKGKCGSLKSDSFCASRLYGNIHMLKESGGFVFTASPGSYQSASGLGFLSGLASGKSSFRLVLDSLVGNYGLRVICSDCRLLHLGSALMPFGMSSGYEVQFRDAQLDPCKVPSPPAPVPIPYPSISTYPNK